MKLKGAEKQFWWHFGHITEAKNIPTERKGFTSIDSSVDDEYLAMLRESFGYGKYLFERNHGNR